MELKDPVVYLKSPICDLGVGPGHETEQTRLAIEDKR